MMNKIKISAAVLKVVARMGMVFRLPVLELELWLEVKQKMNVGATYQRRVVNTWLLRPSV
jgi:hypothetical protein